MVDACAPRLLCKERARRDTARAMYRLLIPVILYLGVVVGAPQESNKSAESYVKIEPVSETIFQNLTPDLSEIESTGTEKNEFERHARSDDDVTTELDQSEATTEVPEPVTEIAEQADQVVQPAKGINTRSKSPSPRFYSKLSYFQKPNYASGTSLANLVERNSKRKFKSRCRCEKIWNCPKLQITVPRCPDEYFMCCF
ncbi:uncharacterized protein [Epargyreus clarus]|uniref:uncharacterized protein n=1 Tax=Epargyreus clarus TaxID=520877 RepID=UPI003C2FA432